MKAIYIVYKGIHNKENICIYLVIFPLDNLKSSKYNFTKDHVNRNEPIKDKGDIKIPKRTLGSE